MREEVGRTMARGARVGMGGKRRGEDGRGRILGRVHTKQGRPVMEP